MNNNIPPGISCNWNGQRWTPTVTNVQDQWAAQNPPGIARGKVWQPKAAPPPPSPLTRSDIDDASDESLEEAIANGYPLDLSTFKSPGSHSRQAESPLDLSLKTRKRCADSTNFCQQYGQVGKKLCLSAHEKQRTVTHHSVDVIPSQNYMQNPDAKHHNMGSLPQDYHPASMSRDTYPSRQQMHHTDNIALKHDYNSKQLIQNIPTIQHGNKVYPQDYSDGRPPYSQTISRDYPKNSNQQLSNVSHHHLSNPLQKVSHLQQKSEISKYSNYQTNTRKEQECVGQGHLKYFNHQEVIPSNTTVPPAVRSNNYHMMPQVQKTLPSAHSSSRYSSGHSTHDSYSYVRTSPSISFNQTQACVSSRSPSFNQNRPSVLSGGLHFKQTQECCSPDSTFVMTPSAEPLSYPNYSPHASSRHSPVITCDIQPGRVVEKSEFPKGSRVSSTSYTPSSSPRSICFPNSPNTISSLKSPSNFLSRLSSPGSNNSESSVMIQHSSPHGSVIMGTSGSKLIDVHSERIIRNPRPRLWNPDQTKLNTWKPQEEIKIDKLESNDNNSTITSNNSTLDDLSLRIDERKHETETSVASKIQLNNPLEIAIPTSKHLETTTESKPKPFSKKHIIMNAFMNDESMKHILEEQPPVKAPQTKELQRNASIPQDKIGRSQDYVSFISPESPKMPTLSPQQKLPAPKVSPLMVEPPTLDLAASQGHRRKHNKVSPNRKPQQKQSIEGEHNNDKQDYSIQPQSSFPHRPMPYKKIPIANVAPMIHGKCNTTEEDSNKTNPDVKQFVSIPTPQPIQAFRLNTAIVNKKSTEDHDVVKHSISKKEDASVVSDNLTNMHRNKPANKRTRKSPTTKHSKQGLSIGVRDSELEIKETGVSLSIDIERKQKEERNFANDKIKCKLVTRKEVKYSKRKTRIISNTKRKADEIRRKARERKTKMIAPGCSPIKFGRLRKRLRMVKPRGFIDFQPEVLETRTRRKSAGRRGYHRNAAYENELWREEKRKAVRHRQRVRRFNKRLKAKSYVNKIATIVQYDVEPTAKKVETVVEEAESTDADNNGTWVVKNTSTMLRNGKSKGALSMKLLFHPQERRFRRRIRKRGKIRYGLRKAVSSASKIMVHTQAPEDEFKFTTSSTTSMKRVKSYPQGIDLHSENYSQYDFDVSDSNHPPPPVPFIPLLPEVKKLSVCKDTGETVLHRAARMGYEDVALSYLQTGIIDVNVRDNAGYTPLHESCVSGNMAIARMLLSYGALVNCASQDGIRPIHDAVDNDFVTLVRLLLSYGADPTISTYGGKTPLKIAHSKKMRSLIQGYLGDINGFNQESEQSVWEFHTVENETGEENGIFCDIPSDPEIEEEEDCFEESINPLFHEITLKEPLSNNIYPAVLLKDVSDFLHVKSSDILKDKSIKAVLIEDCKDATQISSDCSYYYERILSVIDTNCRLLPTKDIQLVFSRFENKITIDKEKKQIKLSDNGSGTTEKSAIAITKSPKHKTCSSRSVYDF